MGRLFDGDIPPSYVYWEDVYALFESTIRMFLNYPWLGWSSELWDQALVDAAKIWAANQPEDLMYYMYVSSDQLTPEETTS